MSHELKTQPLPCFTDYLFVCFDIRGDHNFCGQNCTTNSTNEPSDSWTTNSLRYYWRSSSKIGRPILGSQSKITLASTDVSKTSAASSPKQLKSKKTPVLKATPVALRSFLLHISTTRKSHSHSPKHNPLFHCH